MSLDPTRTVHTTYLEKTDALIQKVLKISPDESAAICKSIENAPKKNQKQVLEFVIKMLKEVFEQKKESLKKIKKIKASVIKFLENEDKEIAEKQIEEALSDFS